MNSHLIAASSYQRSVARIYVRRAGVSHSCLLAFKDTSLSSSVSAMSLWCYSLLLVVVGVVVSAPAPQEEKYPPMPYEYKYDVSDQEKLLFFGANEAGDAQGKVVGGYQVLHPDGRLMTVEYTVDGDSGFVPRIKFEDNANPFGKK